MTRKTVFIPRYGWRVEFFTDFTCESTDTVLDALEQIGCDKHHLLDAEYSMMNCEKDTGLTYSSLDYRSSVAVVYKATSFKEFVNTLSHEVSHICAHITKAFVIKLTEEEFCYMLGDLMADVSDLIFDEAHRHH